MQFERVNVYQSVPNNLDFKPPQISASIKKALKLLLNNSTFSTAFLQIKICKGMHALNYDPKILLCHAL